MQLQSLDLHRPASPIKPPRAFIPRPQYRSARHTFYQRQIMGPSTGRRDIGHRLLQIRPRLSPAPHSLGLHGKSPCLILTSAISHGSANGRREKGLPLISEIRPTGLMQHYPRRQSWRPVGTCLSHHTGPILPPSLPSSPRAALNCPHLAPNLVLMCRPRAEVYARKPSALGHTLNAIGDRLKHKCPLSRDWPHSRKLP